MDNENTNNQEQTQPEQEQPEIHTAREVELESQIAALTSQVAELVEQNKKLYLKLSGTNGSDPEPSIEDKLMSTLNDWAQSGFNPELLYK